jgi:DNA primase
VSPNFEIERKLSRSTNGFFSKNFFQTRPAANAKDPIETAHAAARSERGEGAAGADISERVLVVVVKPKKCLAKSKHEHLPPL